MQEILKSNKTKQKKEFKKEIEYLEQHLSENFEKVENFKKTNLNSSIIERKVKYEQKLM